MPGGEKEKMSRHVCVPVVMEEFRHQVVPVSYIFLFVDVYLLVICFLVVFYRAVCIFNLHVSLMPWLPMDCCMCPIQAKEMWSSSLLSSFLFHQLTLDPSAVHLLLPSSARASCSIWILFSLWHPWAMLAILTVDRMEEMLTDSSVLWPDMINHNGRHDQGDQVDNERCYYSPRALILKEKKKKVHSVRIMWSIALSPFYSRLFSEKNWFFGIRVVIECHINCVQE